jgi:hypothetical protein
MAERQGCFPNQSQPERYYREYIRLPVDYDLARVILRGVISEGPRRRRSPKTERRTFCLHLPWNTVSGSKLAGTRT